MNAFLRGFVSTAIAATALVAVSSNSLAVPPGTQYIENTANGVWEGGGRFPDEVFVYAEHSNAGQFKCPSSLAPITPLEVTFETRISGLAHVMFCGELDVYSSSLGEYALAARIDGENDCITVRGITYPDVYGNASDGLACYQWICRVDNGGAKWMEHTVQVLCSDSNTSVQWNDRTLHVRYQANNGPK